MLDWGLRLAVLMTVPCAVALLVFARPLVAGLFHYGAFDARDVDQTTAALMGWGVGLLGIVAIKVLAPGYYARQDMRTPARVAVAVLVLTQVCNLALVPLLQHAALTLSIGIGALVNAGWLLVGLVRRGTYRPRPGWLLFVLQVFAAAALLAVFLVWMALRTDWTGPDLAHGQRIGRLAVAIGAAALLYFAAAWAAGLRLRVLLRR
jgi:putative peptidoglycan lipid II flippase